MEKKEIFKKIQGLHKVTQIMDELFQNKAKEKGTTQEDIALKLDTDVLTGRVSQLVRNAVVEGTTNDISPRCIGVCILMDTLLELAQIIDPDTLTRMIVAAGLDKDSPVNSLYVEMGLPSTVACLPPALEEFAEANRKGEAEKAKATEQKEGVEKEKADTSPPFVRPAKKPGDIIELFGELTDDLVVGEIVTVFLQNVADASSENLRVRLEKAKKDGQIVMLFTNQFKLSKDSEIVKLGLVPKNRIFRVSDIKEFTDVTDNFGTFIRANLGSLPPALAMKIYDDL